MTVSVLHTSVIIRLLTGDHPARQARATAIFERIERGELTVQAPVAVIADAVYVLASKRLYNLPQEEVAALLTPLVRLPGLHVHGRHSVLAALQPYATTPRLDFGDAVIVEAAMQTGSSLIYSYDT